MWKHVAYNPTPGAAWWVQLQVIAPLWHTVVLLGAASAALWCVRAGGRGAEKCASCGYELRGLPAGAVCPECGGSTEVSG
jgi:hypothetical protein